MMWHDIPKRVCPTCKGSINIVGLQCNNNANFLVEYVCDHCQKILHQEFSMLGLKEWVDNLEFQALQQATAVLYNNPAEKATDDLFLRSMRIKPDALKAIGGGK